MLGSTGFFSGVIGFVTGLAGDVSGFGGASVSKKTLSILTPSSFDRSS